MKVSPNVIEDVIKGVDIVEVISEYIDLEKKVKSAEEALAGARDIIAEWVNEDSRARSKMREYYFDKGVFKSKVIASKEDEAAKFKDYFKWIN